MRTYRSLLIMLLGLSACSSAQDSHSPKSMDAGLMSDQDAAGLTAGMAATVGSGGTMLSQVDTDADGVPDAEDAFPNDPNESSDADLDGVGDNADISPNNLLSCLDSDGDGCDDCVSGRIDPQHDGPDADADGICDACDSIICNSQGVCQASSIGAKCQCDPQWSGDDCTADANACSLADVSDGNPCNAQDASASCEDATAPTVGYHCTCSAGYAFDGTTCVMADAFIGDEVTAMMPTQAAGPLFDTGSTAIVGPALEFSTRNAPGLAGVDLDIAANSFTFSLVNDNPNGAFNQGLLRIEITDLQSVENPESQIVGVAVTQSSFPADTFDNITFGPDWITLDVSDPNLLVPAKTTWSATFAVETQ